MTESLIFKPVTKDNFELAIKVQGEIFPHDNGSENIRASIDKKLFDRLYKKEHPFLTYWLVYLKDDPIGITGLYPYFSSPKDVWLSWFGVRSPWKRKGLGQKIFEWTKQEAQKRGFETLRLYTYPEEDLEAVAFYNALNLFEEPYTLEEETVPHKISIFSASLNGKPVQKWNNKNLYMKEQIDLETKANTKQD
ncbi:MAG: GNAT family N-acetyltransferase [Alphaproteobacteria bacterium]|nr:GNAT family N-acetyltransferase [Alphaproteobacteria bacterium]